MKRALYSTMMLLLFSLPVSSRGQEATLRHLDLRLDNGISLHVIESGDGEPVIFIHGSTGDYSVWENQVRAFAAEGFRAIAYSRRYNWPNANKPQPDHSAAVEAADFARLLWKLRISKAHVVGHSYGAYTALLFALEQPTRIHTLTLAEPPIVPWLLEISGEQSEAAKALHEKLYGDFIGPVKAAFAAGDDDAALRKFLDFVAEKDAIDKLPKAAVDVCRRNIIELKALMHSEQRYPPVSKDRVRQLRVPVLILSGNKSEDVGFFTDPELQRLLPRDSSRRVILKDATHLMWSEKPKESREAVIEFIKSR